MIYFFSNALELAGISLLPLALYLGIVKQNIRAELFLLGIGIGVFFLGWRIGKKK